MRRKGRYIGENSKLIDGAGLNGSRPIGQTISGLDDLPSLSSRVRQIMDIVLSKKRKVGNMICFVMYDITSNKVRIQIAKYLLQKGCTRIQKSIFMADLPSEVYEEIGNDLREVQSLYDNNDSILIVPLSEDYARAMRIIGQQVDLDLLMHTKNTLFF